MARLRPLPALRRVLAVPGFILALWLLQVLTAKLAGALPRAAAAGGLGAGEWLEDGHRLRALVELLIDNPSIAAVIVTSLGASAIVAMIFSIVSAPAILTRLDRGGAASRAEVLGSVATHLPAMLVQTAYGLVLRVACTALAGLAFVMGSAGLPLFLILATFPVLVLDRARAAVVLDGARPYHPMTLLRAVVQVVRRPTWWLIGACLDGIKICVGIGAVVLVLRDHGAGSPTWMWLWIARGAGLLAISVGMWRVALAVEDLRRAQGS